MSPRFSLVPMRTAELPQDLHMVTQGNKKRGRARYKSVDAPCDGCFRSLLDWMRELTAS